MDSAEPALPVASGRLGSFRLLELLGSGAMGTVWLAEDEEEGRRVAIKLFHPQMLAHESFLVRFMREAQAGARVEHPNVVRTYGSEMLRVEGVRRCFLVMEYVEGKTLRALLDEMDQVPEALVREIGRQVAAGLSAIHAAGIVHRDVKPENVLITPDDDVRVMDLGVSKLLDATKVLTREGHFAGSLAYAAPEQIQGREVSSATDLYALGVLLQELVTGHNPFDRETSGAVVRAHLLDEAPDLLDAAPDATPFLAEVVRTLLAKDPAKRFASAAELEATLASGESSAWWKAHVDDAFRRRARIPRVPVRRETALHGREDDLALLRTSFEQARDGRGNTVLLVGEAGIGKSRLVDAFLAGLATADAHVLYGSWPPFGGLGAITDAILAKLGAEDLAAQIRAYLPESAQLAAPFAALLRHEPAPPGSVSLQGDALHASIVRLMHGLAAEKPLVWVLEDLHFADEDARNIVLSLARAVGDRPILLVLTSRPGLPEAVLAHLDRLENLRKSSLARLGAREVMLLLHEALRNERLAEKLCGRVALASDGNPFFIFETIRALRQGQLITQLPDGTWVDTKVIDTIPVPEAVRDLIEARLRDLTREDREILDVGSVLGFEFDPDVVAAVCRRNRLEVLRDLAFVERRYGVVRAQGRRHRFDHHQIQEIVYSDLPVPLREEYHAAVAEAIEVRATAPGADPAAADRGGIDGDGIDGDVSVALAEHFLRGRRGDRALLHLDAAIRHLGRRYENDRLVALADTALGVPGLLTGTRRMDVLRVLVTPQGVLDRMARRDVHRARAEDLGSLARASGDRLAEAEAAIALASLERVSGNLAAGRVQYERALEIARGLGDASIEGRAHLGLSAVAFLTNRFDEARAHVARVRDLGGGRNDPATDVAVAGNLGNVLHREGRLVEAIGAFESSLAIARAAGDRAGEGRALGGLSIVLQSLGRYDEARARGEERLAAARATGDRRSEAGAVGAIGIALWAQGRLADALAPIERSRDLSREVGDRRTEGAACGNLGLIRWQEGRYEEALRLHRTYASIAAETGDAYGESIAATNAGAASWALGLCAESLSHHEHCVAVSRRTGNRELEAIALSNVGSLRTHVGDHSAAVRLLEESLAIAREIRARPVEVGTMLLLADAAAAAGDAVRAEALLDEVTASAQQAGDAPGDPVVLLQRARIRARAGDADAARALLDEAVRVARERSLAATEARALAWRATLPGGDPAAAAARLVEAEPRMEWVDPMEARFQLWRATRDPVHLAEARRRLDFLVEHAPPECRESMVRNVPLHREIAGAT